MCLKVGKTISVYLRKLLKEHWRVAACWPMSHSKKRGRQHRKRGGGLKARVEFALKGVRFNSPTDHPSPTPLHLSFSSEKSKGRRKTCSRREEFWCRRRPRRGKASLFRFSVTRHTGPAATDQLPTRIPTRAQTPRAAASQQWLLRFDTPFNFLVDSRGIADMSTRILGKICEEK